ncbi:MAG: hypothetical protein NTX03_07425 [Bacteroidetes bacterium]|nr:hypothetical protein [Bacteroidota bacterium]
MNYFITILFMFAFAISNLYATPYPYKKCIKTTSHGFDSVPNKLTLVYRDSLSYDNKGNIIRDIREANYNSLTTRKDSILTYNLDSSWFDTLNRSILKMHSEIHHPKDTTYKADTVFKYGEKYSFYDSSFLYGSMKYYIDTAKKQKYYSGLYTSRNKDGLDSITFTGIAGNTKSLSQTKYYYTNKKTDSIVLIVYDTIIAKWINKSSKHYFYNYDTVIIKLYDRGKYQGYYKNVYDSLQRILFAVTRVRIASGLNYYREYYQYKSFGKLTDFTRYIMDSFNSVYFIETTKNYYYPTGDLWITFIKTYGGNWAFSQANLETYTYIKYTENEEGKSTVANFILYPNPAQNTLPKIPCI